MGEIQNTPCFIKNNAFDLSLYLCQIVDNFYINYPVHTLGNVFSNAVKKLLHIQHIFFANNYLMSGLNRIKNTAQCSTNK